MDTLDVSSCQATFVSHLDGALRSALDGFDREFKACRDIQRVFRGFRVRSILEELSWYAMQIQRVVRGHLARKTARFLMDAQDHRRQQARVFFLAVSMQRLFRGFYSRKYVHNFHARKRFIEDVTRKNEEMLRTMQDELANQIEHEMTLKEAKARAEFERASVSLHHLVSTRAIPGVYNPPWAGLPQGANTSDHTLSAGKPTVPSVFGLPIETHLRVATIRHIRTHGMHRPIKNQTTLLGNTAVPVPAYVNADKMTLQASAPYERTFEEEKTERRISKLMELDSKPFMAGGKSEALGSPAGPTVHATAPFQDFYRAARTTRDMENEPEYKAKRVSAVPFVTAYKAAGRAFEDTERDRARMATTLAAAGMTSKLAGGFSRGTAPAAGRRSNTTMSGTTNGAYSDKLDAVGFATDSLQQLPSHPPATGNAKQYTRTMAPAAPLTTDSLGHDPFLSGDYEDSLDLVTSSLQTFGSKVPPSPRTMSASALRRALPAEAPSIPAMTMPGSSGSTRPGVRPGSARPSLIAEAGLRTLAPI